MTSDFTVSAEPSDAVAAFLAANLPPLEEDEGWDHMFLSAYQIGCAALVALGDAIETPWGAIRATRRSRRTLRPAPMICALPPFGWPVSRV